MTDDFIKGLIKLTINIDSALDKALFAKTDKERRRQMMRAGEAAQEVQRRIIDVLK